MEVFYSSCYDYVGEDGEDLVCIKHPFFLLQAVSIVKCLNFFGDAFGAGHNGFHLVDRGARLANFLQIVHTSFERHFSLHLIQDINIFHNIFSAFRTHLIQVCLQSPMIEAKLILNAKFIRPTVFEFIQYLHKPFFLFFEVVGNGVEEKIVKLVIFEEDAGAGAEDVFLVGDEEVYRVVCEGREVVIVHDS